MSLSANFCESSHDLNIFIFGGPDFFCFVEHVFGPGRKDERMDGRAVERTDARAEGRADGGTDGQTDGRTD